MMDCVLLHKALYIPSWVQPTVNRILSKYSKYTLSKHVRDRATIDDDRSHEYTLSKLTSALDEALGKPFEAFEVELTRYSQEQNWIVSKICIRVPYSNNQDVCLSIRTYRDRDTHRYDTTNALIVTAWLNDVNDSHTTLNTNKYLSKEQFEKHRI